MNTAAFLSYHILTGFTPGPNNIMSLSNATRYGFRRSFRFNLGILVGFLLVDGLCAVLTSALYRVLPAVEPYMLVLGAGYIVYLAWCIYRSSPEDPEKHEEKRTDTFLSGILLQFVNVKVILCGISSLTTFILPYYKDPLHLAFFVCVISLIGFAGSVGWAFCGAVFERFLKKYAKTVNTVLALSLVVCALSMLKGLIPA